MITQKIFFYIYSLKHFIFSSVRSDDSQTNVLATTLTVAALLVGCTTMRPAPDCTPQQIARLSSNIASTKAKLVQSRRKLSRVRIMITREGCRGSLFLPAVESRQCGRLTASADRLETQIRTMGKQLAEMNAAISGKPHPQEHVKACTASWLRPAVHKVRKATPKKQEVQATKSTRTLTPIKPKVKVAAGKPIKDIVVPAYAAPESARITPAALIIAPIEAETPAPSLAHNRAPTVKVPPVERGYSTDSDIRVVGPSFFPDQSTPEGPPVLVHESAQ